MLLLYQLLRDKSQRFVSSLASLTLLTSHICLVLPVFADTSRCFPAEVTRFILVGGRGRVQLLLRPALSQQTGGPPHRPTPKLVRGLVRHIILTFCSE